MRVCVFGAGAVGGHLAARLLQAGRHEVSVVARGEQLRAIGADGLTLLSRDEQFTVRPHATTDRPQDLPAQDVVFVSMKAQSQPAAARDIAGLLAPTGVTVFVNNGIPWWWTYRGAEAPGTPLPLLDPLAALWTHVGPQRALGCVIYSANEVVRPGVIRHVANNRWLLGEPDGTRSARLAAVIALLNAAQLQAEAVADIRKSAWTKLLRNVPLNSLCALTRLPVSGLARVPELEALCAGIVEEVAAIAAADGTDLSDQVEIAKAAPRLGAATDGSQAAEIRPSMLQDVLGGRTMEVEAILGQVQAFARATGTPCPRLDVLVALVRGLELSALTPEAAARR
ncbi:2-dehydropantoate 2-reductase [Ramlibacter sp. G-1-2-2]|uniref:2-dehydropantoate 2-reductase n=1 Tax=Ramlibacter agri TaxID=2728837 RepID=A0A848H269_9BURK|nr:2-dehydropantoate 2-reductase [Ramlibacter agri]NML44664.1 2-dehydropantoate 2-reductase [Ramlibacter agri]